MASNRPISNTNVDTVVGIESAEGVIATLGKRLAYDTNSLVPNQTMEKNSELRGNRQMGARVPGNKNPGGSLLRHQTDLSLPLSWYSALGKIVSSVQEQAAPTLALLPATAGLVDAGTHSVKRVITRPNGTAESAASTLVTTDAGHGKITASFTALPPGWTSALYMTAAADALVGPWILVPGASLLGANVISFVIDIADVSLIGAFPTITNNDFKHIITHGDSLPTLSVQRKFPYAVDPAAYFVALAAKTNKATVKVKGAGFYDINLDMLYFDDTDPLTDPFDPVPADWRGGEKLHDAMISLSKVFVDGSEFGSFLDFTTTILNNLDTSDHSVGLKGGLGSLAEGEAEAQLGSTLKVANAADVALTRNTSLLHTLSWQHDFMTPGHYALHELFGISFDPTMPAPQGQGILKFSANGFASQPDGGEQAQITIVNDQPGDAYTT